jgi:hypothetical protein
VARIDRDGPRRHERAGLRPAQVGDADPLRQRRARASLVSRCASDIFRTGEQAMSQQLRKRTNASVRLVVAETC